MSDIIEDAKILIEDSKGDVYIVGSEIRGVVAPLIDEIERLRTEVDKWHAWDTWCSRGGVRPPHPLMRL